MSTIFKRVLILECAIIWMMTAVYAQDEDWEPQTFVSGYVSSVAEFTDQKDQREANRDVGIGLSQVGFLVSHKPKPNIEIKGTFVWDQQIADLQSFVVEAYGIYTFSDQFKVGIGKFLTPLSPVNTYFYAPLNPSVSLPMVVTHYLLTPQSISGVQFSGTFGNDLSVNYNLTYGTYATVGHLRTGIIGLIGREDLVQFVGVDFSNPEQNYDLGGSARMSFEYGIFNLGLNYFDGTRATLFYTNVLNPPSLQAFTSRKYAYGADLHININDRLKLNAEYWEGRNKALDDGDNFNPNSGSTMTEEVAYDGYYAELLYTVGKFTPYVRYERVQDISNLVYVGDPLTVDPSGGVGVPFDPANPTALAPWGSELADVRIPTTALGVGIAYRPSYELLLKIDYRSIENLPNEDAISFTSGIIDDERYNHFIMSAVFSF